MTGLTPKVYTPLPSTQSFYKRGLSTYYVPGSIVAAGDTAASEGD